MRQDYQYITVDPCVGALGAEISGVDIAQTLSEDVIDEIRKAFLVHQMIVFREQDISPAQQIAFAARFGTLTRHPYIAGLEGFPEIMVVRKDPSDEYNFAGSWHADTSYRQAPALGSLLLAKEVPHGRGDTMFASMYAAYDGLSPPLQALLGTLHAEHSYVGRSMLGREQDLGDEKPRAGEIERAVHPVIRTHPETGRRALYVNRMFTERIVELGSHESDALLRFLYEHCEKAQHVFRLRWREGTLAFWDNRCTQHFPLDDYPGELRLMHRVTIAGSETAATVEESAAR